MRQRKCEAGCKKGKEILEAEEIWVRHVQRLIYQHVFEAISETKPHTLQQQLGLYVDHKDILRCRGRLENAQLTEAARYPILLPQREEFTHLVVAKTHKELLHSGVSQVLSAIRQRFWIPHRRATVKAVLTSCTVCRRYEGGTYKLPPMCPYSSSRVNKASTFLKVGLDYLGPMTVKDGNGDKKA